MTRHQATNYCSSVQFFKKKLHKERLSKEREVKLIKDAQNGTQASMTRLVSAHIGLVFTIAKKYTWSDLDLDDLISEGVMGLMVAIKKFDLTRDTVLSTYAGWWIRQNIENYVHNNQRTVRLPVNRCKLYNRCRTELNQTPNTKSKHEVIEQLATENKVSTDVVRRLMTMAKNQGEEFDESIHSSDELSNPELNPEVQLIDKQKFKLLEYCIDSLSLVEKDSVCMKFGLLGYSQLSGQKMMEAIGCSKEKIRLMNIKSMERVRRKFLCEVDMSSGF